MHFSANNHWALAVDQAPLISLYNLCFNMLWSQLLGDDLFSPVLSWLLLRDNDGDMSPPHDRSLWQLTPGQVLHNLFSNHPAPFASHGNHLTHSLGVLCLGYSYTIFTCRSPAHPEQTYLIWVYLNYFFNFKGFFNIIFQLQFIFNIILH